jgi:hypothetical protein
MWWTGGIAVTVHKSLRRERVILFEVEEPQT